MLSIYSLTHLAPTLWQFKRQVVRQHQQTEAFLAPYWAQYPELPARDRRRMRDYPMQFIVFFAELWARLFDRPLREAEKQRLILYAASGCLYDDFFDEESLSDIDLRHIYLQPDSYKPQNDKQRLFIALMSELYRQCAPMLPTLQARFREVFRLFWEAQVSSREQASQSPLLPNRIWEISEQKGGYALVLSRLLLDAPLQAGEEEAVFRVGAWFQLLDDTLDLDKDLRNGVRTLVSICQDMRLIEEKIRVETQKMQASIESLAYPEAKKRWAKFRFFVLSASGYVHIQHLKTLQQQTDDRFDPSKYTEEQLKWRESPMKNLMRALPYLLRYSSKPSV